MERTPLLISVPILHFQTHGVLGLLQTPHRYEKSLSIVTLNGKKLPCEV